MASYTIRTSMEYLPLKQRKFKVLILICVLQYPGVGIDVRRRKIWDRYGPGVHLKVG